MENDNQKTNEPNQSNQNEAANAKMRENRWKTIIFLFALLFIVFIMVIISVNKNLNSGSDKKTSVITQITKVQPDVEMQQTLTGIDFLVTANDDYDIVEVSYELLNSSGNVYVSNKLSQTNLRKGRTYTLTKTFDLSDMLKCSKVSYRISYYK